MAVCHSSGILVPPDQRLGVIGEKVLVLLQHVYQQQSAMCEEHPALGRECLNRVWWLWATAMCVWTLRMGWGEGGELKPNT